MESDSVGVVESSGGDVGVEDSLLGVENTLNILVELVSWQSSLEWPRCVCNVRLNVYSLVYLVREMTSARSSVK